MNEDTLKALKARIASLYKEDEEKLERLIHHEIEVDNLKAEREVLTLAIVGLEQHVPLEEEDEPSV